MYNVEAQLFDNTLDVMLYTVNAMKETGYESADIEEYISEAIREDNYNLILVSKDILTKCNNIIKRSSQSFDSTWRDYYYADQLSNDWDDDFNQDIYGDRPSYYLEDDISEDEYEFDGFQYDKYWDSTYVDDDDEDAYEGFSCCKTPYYNAIE